MVTLDPAVAPAAMTVLDNQAGDETPDVTTPHASARPAVAGKVVPAADNTATGDFWNAYDRADGRLVVVVGDVAGHGDSVAPAAEQLLVLLDAAAAETTDPGQLLAAVNSGLLAEHDLREVVVTAVAIVVDDESRELLWASAGHPRPFWLDDGEPLSHSRPGVPLGVQSGTRYTVDRVPLRGQTGVLLYTDGLLDTRGPKLVRFGPERLARLLRALRARSAAYTVAEVTRCICHFACHRLPDDVAAVAVRWGEPTESRATQ